MRLLATVAVLTVTIGPSAAATAMNGEADRFMARVWTTEDGLAPPPVYSVLEEADGTVWVGSQEGLTILNRR